MIYIKQGHLHTKYDTKPTDGHMYLNYNSEHPPCLKRSTFLTISKTQENSFRAIVFIGSANTYVLYFLRREYPHQLILESWKQTKESPEQNCYTPRQLIIGGHINHVLNHI